MEKFFKSIADILESFQRSPAKNQIFLLFKSFENTKEATDIRIKDNKLGDFKAWYEILIFNYPTIRDKTFISENVVFPSEHFLIKSLNSSSTFEEFF